jgi:hypothetical protein
MQSDDAEGIVFAHRIIGKANTNQFAQQFWEWITADALASKTK